MKDGHGKWLAPEVERAYGGLTRKGEWSWSEWEALVNDMAAWPVAQIESAQRFLVDALTSRRYELVPQREQNIDEILQELMALTDRDKLDDDDHDDYGTEDFWGDLRHFEDFASNQSSRAIVSAIAEKLSFPDLSSSGDGVTMLLRVAPRAYFLQTGLRMAGAGPWFREEEKYSDHNVTVTLASIVRAERSGDIFWLCQLLTAPSVEGARYFIRDLDEVAKAAGFRVVSRRISDAAANTRDLSDLQCFFDEMVPELGSYSMASSPGDSLSARWRNAERIQRLTPKFAATYWDVVAEESERMNVGEATSASRRSASKSRKVAEWFQGEMNRLDTPEMTRSAEAVFGWLSDDAWEYIRSALILRGQSAMDQAIESPSTVKWEGLPIEEGETLLSALGGTGISRELEEELEARPVGPKTNVYADPTGIHKRLRIVRDAGDSVREPSLTLVGEFEPTPTALSGYQREPYTSGTALLIAAIPIKQITKKA